MIYHYDDKDISRKVKAAEVEDLKAYCEAQGFTPEQTELFIKNSIERLYSDEYA